MKIAFHPEFILDLPEEHHFPMSKYTLLQEQLITEKTIDPEQFFRPDVIDEKYILEVHTLDYYNHLMQLSLDKKSERRIGFPLTSALVNREKLIVGGTFQSTQFALNQGIGMSISGGTHHAFKEHGEGFCILNDQAIAAQYLLDHQLAHKILFIDLDAHQGNGTAQIFNGNQNVFTFSMHGAKNYPRRKEESDLDIHLKPGTTDEEYLMTLKEVLPKIIESQKPDFIFYLSGVDILSTDRYSTLSCSIAGCKKRDEFVFELCKAKEIPVQCCTGGGYSRKIQTIVEAHANTFRVAKDIFG